MKIARAITVLLISFIISSALGGCATAPSTASERASLHTDVTSTITRFKTEDPSMARFFDSAHGYAVFPNVGKGAIGVGGAYGRGELFEDDEMVGYCDLSQGTIGFQIGGQAYSEIIFFETRYALDTFKKGNFAFAAQASAVALAAGASAEVDYDHGVAVFTMTRGGLMYEASIGGQKFSFEPK